MAKAAARSCYQIIAYSIGKIGSRLRPGSDLPTECRRPCLRTAPNALIEKRKRSEVQYREPSVGDHSYDFVESEVEFDPPLHVGDIALATCPSWLEFRGLPDFLQRRPRLEQWYRSFVERPSMRATPYGGDTRD
ncbi:hypothetical protein NKH49_17945 [Mesorhizobium sp. M1088]|uniref:hypothetical protein n=1 Tax=Mesorhizobium sp. M1088 TaxID=2957056 RepID=UPI00333D2435